MTPAERALLIAVATHLNEHRPTRALTAAIATCAEEDYCPFCHVPIGCTHHGPSPWLVEDERETR